jgi:hypothetical protein
MREEQARIISSDRLGGFVDLGIGDDPDLLLDARIIPDDRLSGELRVATKSFGLAANARARMKLT